jgi:hypothetical protein
MLDLLGVGVPSGPGGTSGQNNVERERPYLAAKSGKDRACQGWTAEVARSREGVRGVRTTCEGAQ